MTTNQTRVLPVHAQPARKFARVTGKKRIDFYLPPWKLIFTIWEIDFCHHGNRFIPPWKLILPPRKFIFTTLKNWFLSLWKLTFYHCGIDFCHYGNFYHIRKYINCPIGDRSFGIFPVPFHFNGFVTSSTSVMQTCTR